MDHQSNPPKVSVPHTIYIVAQYFASIISREWVEKSVISRSEDNRVSILGVGQNRFVPLLDRGLFDPVSSSYPTRAYHAFLTRLQTTAFSARDRCNLTWPLDDEGTYTIANDKSRKICSHRHVLIVHTDAPSVSDGQSNARAGMGVYFCPNSKHNLSTPLKHDVSTNQKAELEAMYHASRIVRSDVAPRLFNGNGYPARFRVIIVTDSSYVVECLCRHWKNLVKVDGQRRVLVNNDERKIKNSDMFLAINHEVRQLSRVGVQVMYYHIPREFNKDANALAKSSVEKRSWVGTLTANVCFIEVAF